MSRPWLALVIALFCIPLFIGLGRGDLRGDEAGHSFSVDRILEGAGWLAPKSSPDEDAVFLEKPPLKFWLVAAPIKLGVLPHDEFGLRFWDAVFAGAAFVYVFAIGSRLAGPISGFVATLLLFIHWPLLFEHGVRGNNMEAALLLCYCGGIFHFMEWVRLKPDTTYANDPAVVSAFRRTSLRHAVAVALYFVLGFMTKFVAALFLPLVLAAASVLFPDWRRAVWRGMKDWLVASGVALVLIAPWFVYAHVLFGRQLWATMFGTHIYTRFTSYLDPAHVQPWPFYFTKMYEWFDRSGSIQLVIAGGAALLLMTVLRRWADGVLVVLWFALPLVLISFGTSKLYHYAYPFVPPAALGAGYLAGLVAMLAPAPTARAFDALENYTRTRAPRVASALERPGVRTTLRALASLALAIGVVDVVYGPFRIQVGAITLFRSSGVLRPALAAALFSVLAGAGRTASRAIVLLIIASQLPLPAYRDTLAQLNTATHPMRSARDCVLDVQARLPPDSTSRGLYVDGLGHGFNHEHYYYFRKIRPWEVADAPSPDRLYDYLYVQRQTRPMLVLQSVYRDALHGAGAHPGGPPATPMPLASFTDVVMLMPGPYSVCSSEAARDVQQ